MMIIIIVSRYMHYVMKSYRPTRLRNISTKSDAIPLYDVIGDARQTNRVLLLHGIVLLNYYNIYFQTIGNGNSTNEEIHYEDAQMTEITV